MKKQRKHITESMLNKVIKESVKNVLNEIGNSYEGSAFLGAVGGKHGRPDIAQQAQHTDAANAAYMQQVGMKSNQPGSYNYNKFQNHFNDTMQYANYQDLQVKAQQLQQEIQAKQAELEQINQQMQNHPGANIGR